MPNSSAKSAASLHLSLEPSRLLMRGLAALHLLAGLCAVANPLPWWAKLSLLSAIALSFHLVRRDYGWAPLTRALVLEKEGSIVVARRGGTVLAALAGGSVVTAGIVILSLRTEAGRPLAIPICRDSLDAESFRRLRVGLRCGRWKAERE